RHLARRDSKVLAVVGAGRVARNQVEVLVTEFQLKAIGVATRTREKGEAFVNEIRSRFAVKVDLVDAEAAVRDADLVVAATTSKMPVVQGHWLKPGTFVAAVGAYAVEHRELDDEAIRRASCHVIDSRADVLDRAGDFVMPIKAGILKRE